MNFLILHQGICHLKALEGEVVNARIDPEVEAEMAVRGEAAARMVRYRLLKVDLRVLDDTSNRNTNRAHTNLMPKKMTAWVVPEEARTAMVALVGHLEPNNAPTLSMNKEPTGHLNTLLGKMWPRKWKESITS